MISDRISSKLPIFKLSVSHSSAYQASATFLLIMMYYTESKHQPFLAIGGHATKRQITFIVLKAVQLWVYFHIIQICINYMWNQEELHFKLPDIVAVAFAMVSELDHLLLFKERKKKIVIGAHTKDRIVIITVQFLRCPSLRISSNSRTVQTSRQMGCFDYPRDHVHGSMGDFHHGIQHGCTDQLSFNRQHSQESAIL